MFYANRSSIFIVSRDGPRSRRDSGVFRFTWCSITAKCRGTPSTFDSWRAANAVTGDEAQAEPPPARANEVVSPDGRLALRRAQRAIYLEVVRTEDDTTVLRLPYRPPFSITNPTGCAFTADGDLVTPFGGGALIWDTGRRAD